MSGAIERVFLVAGFDLRVNLLFPAYSFTIKENDR